ncbi:uncharacterized protein LOC126628666, partial [Malus sylvestris]|uniref:uncharacterized protein LOC126628666 n=1 Tax=Malus sylvestris TaxID=3752 RepID=UPI0021AD2016
MNFVLFSVHRAYLVYGAPSSLFVCPALELLGVTKRRRDRGGGREREREGGIRGREGMLLAERREGGRRRRKTTTASSWTGRERAFCSPLAVFVQIQDEVHAKIVVAGISTTCSQKIHNQLAQPILPKLLENSTTKVIEYGRKHVEGRDGDSTDVGKSGDPLSRLLGPKEEEGVNNVKLALGKLPLSSV